MCSLCEAQARASAKGREIAGRAGAMRQLDKARAPRFSNLRTIHFAVADQLARASCRTAAL